MYGFFAYGFFAHKFFAYNRDPNGARAFADILVARRWGLNLIPVEPVPIKPTRLPVKSTPSRLGQGF
jgi:hypothetical protein